MALSAKDVALLVQEAVEAALLQTGDDADDVPGYAGITW